MSAVTVRSSRREVLALLSAGLGASVLGCGRAKSAADAVTKGPIVIVPGTGAGAGAYERLTHSLAQRGRDARALSLAGMGDRVSEIRPDIDANSHAQEIADYLIQRDLRAAT